MYVEALELGLQNVKGASFIVVEMVGFIVWRYFAFSLMVFEIYFGCDSENQVIINMSLFFILLNLSSD